MPHDIPQTHSSFYPQRVWTGCLYVRLGSLFSGQTTIILSVYMYSLWLSFIQKRKFWRTSLNKLQKNSRNWNEFKRNKFNLKLQVAFIFWKSAQGLPHKAVQSSVSTKNYASLTKADVVALFSLLFWLIFSWCLALVSETQPRSFQQPALINFHGPLKTRQLLFVRTVDIVWAIWF